MIALKNKTVAYVFLPSFNNNDDCLCQERLFRSRNLAAMVTWRHLSLYCRRGQSYFFLIRHRCKSDTSLEQTPGVGFLLFLSHFLGSPAKWTPPRRSSVAFYKSLLGGYPPKKAGTRHWSLLFLSHYWDPCDMDTSPPILSRFLRISFRRTPSSLMIHFTYLQFHGYKVITCVCSSNRIT